MLRWGDARAGARQVGRAPVGGQPRNKGGPVAAQPCCLPEHKQHSPRSVSGRYPGDTRVSGSVCGQRAEKPATNTERAHCPGPHMCPRGHPHVTLQYMCTKHIQGMCVYASHMCLCMEYMSTRNRVPICVGNVHMGAPCGYMRVAHVETPRCATYRLLLFQAPVTHPWVSLRIQVTAPELTARAQPCCPGSGFFFFLPFCVACVKETATHSNILACRLRSTGSQRVGHN